MVTKMPSMKDFADASKMLTGAGWLFYHSIMSDQAKKDGVTNFGKLFVRDGVKFYLNYKTIGDMPK